MSTLITSSALESQPWLTQTGLDVNPIPADSYAATLRPGGVLVVANISSKAGGAALVTCKTVFPAAVNLAAFPYFGLDLKAYIAPEYMPQLGRLEIDVKRCIVPGAVGNCSSQLNTQTGEWQIDGNPPGWKNAGFQPILTPGWNKLKFRYHMDADGYSVISTRWGTMQYQIPLTMQNVPLESEAWANAFNIQLQNMILQPGTLVVCYTGIDAYLSDAPIA